MTQCKENTIQDLYSEGMAVDEISTALYKQEDYARMAELERKAREKGYYVHPDNRIKQYIDRSSELKGKTITIENLDGNTFEDVQVKEVEAVGPNLVRVNRKYTVNLDRNMLTDGMHAVSIMGSEETGFEGKNLGNVTGTVLQVLDQLVAETKRRDGDKLDEESEAVLDMVLEGYKEVLDRSGRDVEINVEMIEAIDEDTRNKGYAQPEQGKMRLLFGNAEYNTATDILAHELQHILIHTALKKNPKLLREVAELRRAMEKELSAKYGGEGWKLFIEHKKEPTSDDIEFAKERWHYVFENAKTPEDEFLAAATTNKYLVAQMEQVTTVTEGNFISKFRDPAYKLNGELKEGMKPSRWIKILNKIVDAINKLYGSTLIKKNAADTAMTLLGKALELEYPTKVEKEKSTYDKVLDAVEKGDEKLAELQGATLESKDDMVAAMRSSSKDKFKKFTDAMWRIKGLRKARSAMLQNNVFNSITKDMTNEYIATFYKKFRESKAFEEKEVVAVKNTVASELMEHYELENVSEDVRKLMKRVILDADAVVFGNADKMLEYLKDENKGNVYLDKVIKKHGKIDTMLEKEDLIDAEAELALAINELAELLVYNRVSTANVHTNAAQIAYDVLGTQKDGVIDEIDRAVSVRAMQLLDKNDKEVLIEALEKDEKAKIAVDAMINMVKEDRAKILDKAYSGNRMYEVKGGKQEQFKDNKKHYVVNAEEMKALTKSKAFHNVGKQNAVSELMGEDMYVVIGDNVEPGYTQGLMSTIQLKNEGDSLRNLMKERLGLTEDEVDDKIELYAKLVKDEEWALIPERSGENKIYDYRLRLPYEVKRDYMSLNNDVVGTVAATVSNLTHKQEAMSNNLNTVRFLNSMYIRYKSSPEHTFIEISEKSEGKFAEYWEMIPHYMKQIVSKEMGGKLMIEESLLTDMFGYKDVSITEAPWIKNSIKRQRIAKKIEMVVQELAKNWKKQVVAFTEGTIFGNNQSNMVLALEHTANKNPLKYINKFRQRWGDMNDYQKARRELLAYDVRVKAGEYKGAKLKEVQRKMDKLRGDMESNPMKDLLADGQYNAILEDINVNMFDNKGILEEKLDAALDKLSKDGSKFNFKKMFDLVYMRQGTVPHDAIMKLTTYSDVIAKQIILEDMKERAVDMRAAGKSYKEIGSKLHRASEKEMKDFFEKGITPQTWLDYLDQLTVNYSYLDNRWLKYFNDSLMLSFTKYLFRSIRPIIRLFNERGFTVGLVEGTQAMLGIDAETPLDQLYTPMDTLGHKMFTGLDVENVFEMLVKPAAFR
jgi:hypothetical protein